MTPSVSPSIGSADGAVPATTSRPSSSASLAQCPWDPGGRGARARSGPPRPTWAHWHGGLAQLQRQAAEPGRMTSPEQVSTSPSSLSGPWAVASNTGLCPRQECKRSRKPQGPGHKLLGATPSSESAFSTIVITPGAPSTHKLTSQGALCCSMGFPSSRCIRPTGLPSTTDTNQHLLHGALGSLGTCHRQERPSPASSLPSSTFQEGPL